MKYTKDEIDIFKCVIRDYKRLKEDIDEKIKNGYTIENLYDYIRHLASCDITNCDLNDDYKYIDFNYCDMCVSILKHGNSGVYLGESLETWNDKGCYYIGTFNSIRELEKIIKEYEENDKN